ncbi:ABC transporter permease [Brachyspira pilosicoli]|uniref:Transport permease protein n=1 Tax=Brachyspira pilosicoli (strain ATCC BAA-1826 / 95/1000) TaxID=759914 RepID=D8ICN8_BRAP9|nr:ABC transporter permease [Brachyspira pilosicoli]ADK30911.1 ABC transporter integral membrane type-2 domain-containing protein [Brachyspira pilosicoli 95/1000]MBW5393305.1 ABC transporter permease [Brachyspira pilosicoli]MBW5399950.1 ABC transporter permease [Brachyspira pilosicoli]WIH83283.1 ABC transporter permease [Brachyspira pilosicoli]SUW09298.1 ABC transporter integral membrane type-2 domain-containing protein [Brachyspira pilosicoli]
MKTIFKLTIKKAIRDPFLIFWSIFFPIVTIIALGILFNTESYTIHILTAMTCVSVLAYSFMTTSFNVLSQRRRGVYNLLKVTPLPLYKYIISSSCAWVMISIISSLFVFISCALFFKLEFSFVSILLFLPIIIAASLVYIFISFFVSSLVKNNETASILYNIILMGSMFLSDGYYSLYNAPSVVKFLSRLNIFQYFLNAVRGAYYFDFQSYFIGLAVLLSCLIIALILAVNTFRYVDK